MTSGMQSRRFILETLLSSSKEFKKEILRSQFETSSLSPQEKCFAAEVVQGITRHRLTLEWLTKQYCKSVPKDTRVLYSLWMGIYQMLFLDAIPPYAAIHTTVELLKEGNSLKEARYGNAVLRTMQREMAAAPPAPGSNILPISSKKAWAFVRPIFPDPEKAWEEYASVVYSYPLFLVKRWQQRFGKETTQKLLEAGNLVAPLFLRPRRERSEIEKAFSEKGISWTNYEGLLQVDCVGKIEDLPLFAEGAWMVTGPAPHAAVLALGCTPGMKVLDLCAAPGGKSAHIADLVGDRGEVWACDISKDRLRRLEENKARLHLNIQIQEQDALHLPKSMHNAFERVLLDAPCSNSAVLSKRTEARWRFTKKNLQGLSSLQGQLIRSAAKALKQGGILLYSTCSLEPEENEDVVEGFLKENSHFSCEEKKQILPFFPILDGGTFFRIVSRVS